MMKKRLLLCALLLCILLTACSTAAETEPVSISFMHGWGGSGADHVGMRELFAAFEEENPDIHIVYDTSPDLEIVMEKAADLLAVDKAPSIISTNGNVQYVSNAKKKGVALDLTPYLKEDATFASDVSPQILQALQESDGAVYTLPDAVEYIGYWYNASLFRQAGITDTGTPEGTVVPPRTWEEFWAACDALAQIAPQTGAVPLQMQVSQMGFFLGARLAGASEQALAFMQKEASVCRREDAELAVSELLRALSYDTQRGSTPDIRQNFFDGKSAICIDGVWANTEFDQTTTKQEIRYAAFPGFSGETIAYANPATGYVISNDGSERQIDACVRFLKYMLSKDVQEQIVTKTHQAPSNPNISDAWIHEQVPVLADAVQVCKQADLQILTLYSVLPAKTSAQLEQQLEELLRGKDVQRSVVSIIADLEQERE
ncbi:MAG: ABC transporter substrate-binding protein [Oscillospiraceae bacterium]